MNIEITNLGGISCLVDVETMEKTPLAERNLPERNLPESTYQLLRKSCLDHSEKVAITYIENPDDWTVAAGQS